jgi:hypothetical protein
VTTGGDQALIQKVLPNFNLVSVGYISQYDLGLCASCDQSIVDTSKGGLDQTVFFPAIHHGPPHVLFPKPWFRLWPTYENLRPEHVLALQWSMTVDLIILTMLLNGWFISILSSPWTRSLVPPLTTKVSFIFQAPGDSTLKPYCCWLDIFHNGRSTDICPLQSMTLPTFLF